jgi:hypothetical protein
VTRCKKDPFPNWEVVDLSYALSSEINCTALLRSLLRRAHFLYSQWLMHSSFSCWNVAPQLIPLSHPRARLRRSIL